MEWSTGVARVQAAWRNLPEEDPDQAIEALSGLSVHARARARALVTLAERHAVGGGHLVDSGLQAFQETAGPYVEITSFQLGPQVPQAPARRHLGHLQWPLPRCQRNQCRLSLRIRLLVLRRWDPQQLALSRILGVDGTAVFLDRTAAEWTTMPHSQPVRFQERQCTTVRTRPQPRPVEYSLEPGQRLRLQPPPLSVGHLRHRSQNTS